MNKNNFLQSVSNSTSVTLENIRVVISSNTLSGMSEEWRKAAIDCLNQYLPTPPKILKGQLIRNKSFPDVVTRVIDAEAVFNGLVVEQIDGLNIKNNMKPGRVVVPTDEWELVFEFKQEQQLLDSMRQAQNWESNKY